MQCTVYIYIHVYDMYTHNTRRLSSMRNINDGLTALCVSQQRFEKDHTRCIPYNTSTYRRTTTVDYGPDGHHADCYKRVFSVLLLLLLLLL